MPPEPSNHESVLGRFRQLREESQPLERNSSIIRLPGRSSPSATSLARLEMVIGTGSFYREASAERLLLRPHSEARCRPDIPKPTLQSDYVQFELISILHGCSPQMPADFA
jgi:hypothetical protein